MHVAECFSISILTEQDFVWRRSRPGCTFLSPPRYDMQLYVIHLAACLGGEDGSNHWLKHRKTSRCTPSWHQGEAGGSSTSPTCFLCILLPTIIIIIIDEQTKCKPISLQRWPTCNYVQRLKHQERNPPPGVKPIVRGSLLPPTDSLYRKKTNMQQQKNLCRGIKVWFIYRRCVTSPPAVCTQYGEHPATHY